MDQPDDGNDLFADLNPLSAFARHPSYTSKAPVSVSLVSLFSMDQPPSQLGLLPTIQNTIFNSPLIQMESASEKLSLQTPPFSSNNPPDPGTLLASNPGTNKLMSTFRLPEMESLTQIAIPPSQLSSRNKRKSPTEKSAKPLAVSSPRYQAKTLKAQTESFDIVRSKLRDSLASALTLASSEKPSGTEASTSSSLTSNVVKEEGVPLIDVGLGDDLLQGNGLSWAADAGPKDKSTEVDGGTAAKRAKVDFEVTEDKSRALATTIEAELFSLFGGVNKKYKEKGRSLLFNLKDQSNPELRTRVISGDITPQRLCSMSAEELASKELSEWRMAKAEEFAHMVVLQEDVDLRRVVKKTHKGEVQVEVEDDSTSVEVAVGSNSLPPILSRSKGNAKPLKDSTKNEEHGSEKVSGEDVEDIQELMVDGKEAETLPPIVSLDEFMEALNSEPPFENIPAVAGAESSLTNSLPDATVNSAIAGDSLNASISSKTDNSDSKKVNDGHKETIPRGVDLVPKAITDEHMWEGVIQLTVSSVATVQAFFKSGEKASTKDWPAVMEVKGRVRVEAFEKFLKDLPLSKSRAMMVFNLRWKEGSAEGGRKAISEAAESYVADGRLGYMEPCPGVELYVCPPGSTTSRLLPADALPPSESPSELGGGTPLVGVVVWRRALLSPRPPKQPSSKSNKVPLSRKPKIPPPSPREQERVVDDVPPGFGPPREDDDLPEFDFRRTSFSGPDSAVQMRELIQKYGSHSGPVASKPLWEDDDDIPEWKPQQLAPPPQPPQPQPQFHPHVAVQPGAWQPYGGGHGFVAGDRRGVMDWRYDVHRSRGM